MSAIGNFAQMNATGAENTGSDSGLVLTCEFGVISDGDVALLTKRS